MAKEIQVYDTPSGLGGSFTVSVLSKSEDTDELVCRVWYGRFGFHGWESWRDLDGLTNPRQLKIAH